MGENLDVHVSFLNQIQHMRHKAHPFNSKKLESQAQTSGDVSHTFRYSVFQCQELFNFFYVRSIFVLN